MELQSIRQGKKSIEEYEKEFETLMARCDIRESSCESIARFINGLRLDIASVVELQQYQTLEDVIKLVSRVERHQHRRSQRSYYHHKSEEEEKKGDGKEKNKEKVVAKKVNDQTQQKKSRDIKCFKCLGHGHIASQCPNKRVMVMKGKEIESQEEEDQSTEEQENSECDIEAIPLSEDGYEIPLGFQDVVPEQEPMIPYQRTNLFYVQYMVQGKTCLTVIDTSNCANVVSAGLVAKLGLQVEQHPKPYALHWISHQGVVHVHKQVRLPISCGDYTDEVMCDVVLMDATQLIMWRPW